MCLEQYNNLLQIHNTVFYFQFFGVFFSKIWILQEQFLIYNFFLAVSYSCFMMPSLISIIHKLRIKVALPLKDTSSSLNSLSQFTALSHTVYFAGASNLNFLETVKLSHRENSCPSWEPGNIHSSTDMLHLKVVTETP